MPALLACSAERPRARSDHLLLTHLYTSNHKAPLKTFKSGYNRKCIKTWFRDEFPCKYILNSVYELLRQTTDKAGLKTAGLKQKLHRQNGFSTTFQSLRGCISPLQVIFFGVSLSLFNTFSNGMRLLKDFEVWVDGCSAHYGAWQYSEHHPNKEIFSNTLQQPSSVSEDLLPSGCRLLSSLLC